MDSTDKEKSDTATEPKDCFSCKMISGTLLLLASVHVYARGVRGKLRSTKLLSAMFGTSNYIFCLGKKGTLFTKIKKSHLYLTLKQKFL